MLVDAFAGLDNFIELSITDIIYLAILVYSFFSPPSMFSIHKVKWCTIWGANKLKL